MNTAKRSSAILPGVSLPDFEHSAWIYEQVKTAVAEKDLLISNNAAALGYVTGQQCLEYRALHRDNLDKTTVPRVPGIISEKLKNRSGEVFIALEKKYPFRLGTPANWHDFLELYRYEILREDPDAILVRLLPAQSQ